MTYERGSFVINQGALTAALKKKGFKSYSQLARALGIHRNTIGRYLSGEPALPQALERIMLALDLSVGDLITRRHLSKKVPGSQIAELIDQFSSQRPDCAFVLFGSRARGSYKQYSDYDLGVYRSAGLSFEAYSRLLDCVAEWNDSRLSSVQLVNFCKADSEFLENVAEDLVFLAGSILEWQNLLSKLGLATNE